MKKINKLNKKAIIITWFIIIGCVVLIGAITYSYLTAVSISQLNLRIDELKVLKQYTELCLGNVLDNSLYIAAAHGGFILPEKTTETPFGNTSLGVAEIETSEMQISKFISDNMPSCLNNYSYFIENGLNIKQGLISTKALFGENTISVAVTMPVKIIDNSSKVQIETFTDERNIRIGKLIKYAKNVLEHEDVWLSYLSTLDINTTAIKQDNVIIYVFEDETSIIKDTNYLFMFAKDVKE